MAIDLPNYSDNTSTSTFAFENKTLGDVISSLIPYIYLVAGLAMLVMLIMGGFKLMTAAGDQAKTKDGYGKITSGIVGFLIIFVSYFVVQIVELVLGVKIF